MISADIIPLLNTVSAKVKTQDAEIDALKAEIRRLNEKHAAYKRESEYQIAKLTNERNRLLPLAERAVGR